jgi:hypothetical protein
VVDKQSFVLIQIKGARRKFVFPSWLLFLNLFLFFLWLLFLLFCVFVVLILLGYFTFFFWLFFLSKLNIERRHLYFLCKFNLPICALEGSRWHYERTISTQIWDTLLSEWLVQIELEWHDHMYNKHQISKSHSVPHKIIPQF